MFDCKKYTQYFSKEFTKRFEHGLGVGVVGMIVSIQPARRINGVQPHVVGIGKRGTDDELAITRAKAIGVSQPHNRLPSSRAGDLRGARAGVSRQRTIKLVQQFDRQRTIGAKAIDIHEQPLP